MKIFSHIFFLLTVAGILFLAHPAQAQNKRLLATADKETITIGDAVSFTLAIEAKTTDKVFMPLLTDTLAHGLEITSFPLRDTVPVDSYLRHVLTLHFTAFDSGFYQIPPFKVAIVSENGDTSYFFSIPLLIRADYPQMTAEELAKIDTTQQEAIFDIKSSIDTPFTFEEFWAYLKYYTQKYGIWVLLFAFLAVAAYMWYKKYFKQKPVVVEKPKEIVPPHVKALKSLKELSAKQLWQNNQYKPFHSELTEIIRLYIEERFQVPALEQTSDQILNSLYVSGMIPADVLENLKRILHTADFVKFAKYVPQSTENESSESLAELFIQSTLPSTSTTPAETVKTA